MNSKGLKRELEEHLKELRLPAMRASYADLAQKAEAEQSGYPEYLHSLAAEECAARRQNRIEGFLRESRLPLEKNLAALDLKRLPKKATLQMKVLLEADFLDRRENVLVFGNPGSGKTHLVCALGQELIHQGRRIYFTTTSLLVQGLLRDKRDLKLDRRLKYLSRYEAIILDDIGYVQQDRDEMEVLFTLLAQRYERGSLLLTSNLPFSKWDRIFKDPMTTAAAIDRLVHHSVILELNVSSYRMEKAQERKNREFAATEKREK
jgi:DNA replication protein DnaC